MVNSKEFKKFAQVIYKISSLEDNKTLIELLSDIEVMKVKTLRYHWNTEGRHFKGDHAFFLELWEELYELGDVVAERIRFSDTKVPGSMKVFLEKSIISDDYDDPEDKNTALLLDYQKMVERVKPSIDTIKDAITVDILTETVRAFEKRIWFLKSILK